MGLGGLGGFSSSVHDSPRVVERTVEKVVKVEVKCTHCHPKEVKLPNPNPRNFKVVRSEQIFECLVVEVLYPDCTNYEGRKIMVYANTTLDKMLKKNGNVLDPHFCENKDFVSPIARFEPTERGWKLARALAKHYHWLKDG